MIVMTNFFIVIHFGRKSITDENQAKLVFPEGNRLICKNYQIYARIMVL